MTVESDEECNSSFFLLLSTLFGGGWEAWRKDADKDFLRVAYSSVGGVDRLVSPLLGIWVASVITSFFEAGPRESLSDSRVGYH